jgi:hypothetical protein
MSKIMVKYVEGGDKIGNTNQAVEIKMHNKDNTKEADEILARIIDELEKQGKKPSELIRYLNLPRGIFAAWKAGRSRYYCEHLAAISQFLDVSVEYLVIGEKQNNKISNSMEQELIDCFRCLDKAKQEAVLQNVRWLSGSDK